MHDFSSITSKPYPWFPEHPYIEIVLFFGTGKRSSHPKGISKRALAGEETASVSVDALVTRSGRLATDVPLIWGGVAKVEKKTVSLIRCGEIGVG